MNQEIRSYVELRKATEVAIPQPSLVSRRNYYNIRKMCIFNI